MNYFDQLLDSYSKLKQRNLVLLEKSEAGGPQCHAQLEKLAAEKPEGLEAARAFFDNPEQSRNVTDQQEVNGRGEPYAYLATDGSAPIKKETAAEGEKKPETDTGEFAVDTAGQMVTKITGGPLGSGYFTSKTFEDFYREHCDATKKLINFFGGDISSAMRQKLEGAGLGNALNRAGTQVADSLGLPIEEVDPRLVGELESLLGNYADLTAMARRLHSKENWTGYDKKTGEYRGATEDESPDKTGTVGAYVTGGAGQSIERQISVGKVGVISTDEGLRLTNLTADQDLIVGSLKSANKLVSFVLESENADSVPTCEELPRLVRKKGNDHLVFHSNGDISTGMVITRSGPLAYALDKAEQICGDPIPKISQAKYGAGKLNDFRGKALEAVDAGASFMEALEAAPNLTDKEKGALIEEFSTWLKTELLEDEKLFRYAMRWALDTEAATDLESAFMRDTVNQLADATKTPELYRQFLKKSLALELPTTKLMKADGAIPVGLVTGTGHKDDLLYMYKKEADARAAMERAGLDMDGDVVKMSVKELRSLSKKPTMQNLFQRTHGLDDNDIVYAVGSGVKSYFADGGVKVGEQTAKKSSKVNRGEKPSDFAEGFHEVTRARLGLSKDDTSVADYQRDVLDNISSAIDDIVTEETSKMVDGKVKDISPANLNTILKNKLKNLTFPESLTNNVGSLLQDLDLNNPKDRSELNDGLNRLLTTAQMVQDCNARDEGELTTTAMNARKNLAYTVNMIGGSLHDGVVNQKILNDMKVRVGSHMKPIQTACDGILTGDWDIKISSGGHTVKLIDNNNRNNSLSFGKERLKDADNNYSPNYTINTSKGLMESTSTFTEIVEPEKADKEESLLMSFFKNQMILLEGMINSTHTNA